VSGRSDSTLMAIKRAYHSVGERCRSGGPSPAVAGELCELCDEALCTEQAYDGVIPESTTSHS